MITKKWDEVLKEEYEKEYFKKIAVTTNVLYKEKEMFPPKNRIFHALKLTDYDQVKVVILGQDPYHGVGEANGLAFAVNENVKIPPSLRNIYKELYDDLHIQIASHGNLVEKDKPASCRNMGWEELTDAIIKKINEKDNPVVFILWGAFARSKKKYITNKKHLVLESTHPSPFSAHYGFFGSKPFSKTNEFLRKNNIKEINWQIK